MMSNALCIAGHSIKSASQGIPDTAPFCKSIISDIAVIAFTCKPVKCARVTFVKGCCMSLGVHNTARDFGPEIALNMSQRALTSVNCRICGARRQKQDGCNC